MIDGTQVRPCDILDPIKRVCRCPFVECTTGGATNVQTCVFCTCEKQHSDSSYDLRNDVNFTSQENGDTQFVVFTEMPMIDKDDNNNNNDNNIRKLNSTYIGVADTRDPKNNNNNNNDDGNTKEPNSFQFAINTEENNHLPYVFISTTPLTVLVLLCVGVCVSVVICSTCTHPKSRHQWTSIWEKVKEFTHEYNVSRKGFRMIR